ncbi:unnamed protein product [Protopolystoma xenopodis]|uniref:Uncharacterized protein n=1 Tax=Protopolystoma xenopodis TaxID=117903 RepID=A0A448XFW6_9PLAT|nr:unnamed protein product [Protopolystoma xenopodis]
MLPRSDDVRHVIRNRRRLPRQQRQYDCSSKANRQLVKRNPPSSSGGTDHRISSPSTLSLEMEVSSTNILVVFSFQLYRSSPTSFSLLARAIVAT